MDKASSVIAALDAGKLPSQEQIDEFIDWFLESPLSQIEPTSSGGELSEQGRIIVGDIRERCCQGVMPAFIATPPSRRLC